MSDAPLLGCDAARIDVGGAAIIEGLSSSSAGRGLGLVGAWTPLFALLGREAVLAAGRIEIAGASAARAVAAGVVGLARTAAALPGDWSVAELLGHSARLAGIPRSGARAEAARAAAEVGVEALAARRVASLVPAQRRAISVAHAVIGSPPVIAVEAPFDDLDEAGARALAEVLSRAAASHRLIVSAAFIAPTGAARGFFDQLEEVLVLEAGSLVAEGPPGHALAPGRRYLVAVSRHATELAEALAARGVELAVASPGDPTRLVVDLGGPFGPDDLLSIALDLGAPVLELVPLATR